MKNSVFKKLIASLLTLGILVSGVGVFAVEDTENTLSKSSDESIVSSNEDNTVGENNIEDEALENDSEPTITYSTASENGGVSDNTLPTNVVWEGTVSNSPNAIGSETNPYDVCDTAHFMDMSRLINQDTNANKYFKLTANIDLSGIDIDDISNSAANGLSNTIVSIDPTMDGSDNIFFVTVNKKYFSVI